jgi:hypothetical protein
MSNSENEIGSIPRFIVTRKFVNKLIALAPEREAEFMERFNRGFASDEAHAIYDELEAEAKRKANLKVARQSHAQSTEILVELETDNAKAVKDEWERSAQHNAKVFTEMRRERNGPETWRLAQWSAQIESTWFLQQQEEVLRRARVDICGLWGPPTLASRD